MLKKFILVLALGLCVVSPAQALNIIWACTSFDNLADGQNDDFEWAPWLRSLGHTVDVQVGYWADLTDAKIATLNAADVIILSRAMASDSTAGSATEIAQWNAIKKPIISLHAYNARSSRNLWLNSTTINSLTGPLMVVKDPTHPIFQGITLDASNQVAVVNGTTGTGQTSFIGTQDVGNGKLLAVTATGTNTWIAEWQAGASFYSGSGDTVAAKRMLFCAGTQESGATPTGALNLTDDGKKMFNNALYYMAGKSLGDYAKGPQPADGATDVRADTQLSWKPSTIANQHDVYFGTVLADVNSASRTTPKNVLVSQGQDANSYDPAGVLTLGQTYYWRIDEVNTTDNKIVQGSVWSFTVEPFAYVVQNITATASSQQSATAGPQNTVNGSGLIGDGHDADAKNMWLNGSVSPAWIQYDLGSTYKLHEMWVWNHNTAFESILGFGIQNATVEYSTDGTAWTKLGDFEFNQASGEDGYVANTTVSFGGATAKFVRITSNGTWGGDSSGGGLSEVRFFNIPVLAREPQPATNSTNVNPTTLVLGWRPGREAASHSVYVGADANALTLIGTATTTSFTPANLSLSTKYYWRVDEVNAAETPATWTGDAWNFTTSDYLVVDDMESYNDVDPTRVFDVWVDGYGTTSNGSVVGYSTAASGTFNETTIIHGGTQSMPFAYGTDGIATSEATRTFDATQDWTAAGIKTLVLFFHGDAANTTGQLYVKINSTKVNYGGNVAGLAAGLWKQWNVDLASASGANLKAVKSLTIGISSGKGILYFDDLRLYKAAPDVVVPVNPGTTGLVSLFDMESGKTADSVSGITGTLTSITFANSMTGLGQTAVFNGTTGYVDLGADYWTKVVSKLSSCTLAMWVNYTGTGSAWQRIIDLGCGTNVNTFLTTGANTLGMARFVVKTDVPNAASTATGYSEATVSAAKSLTVGWHHIAGVVDATGGTPVMYLYVDGAVAGGPSAGRLPKDMTVQTGTAWQMWLGRSQYTADPYFNGSLDDLRVYNRALSAGEVGYLAGDR